MIITDITKQKAKDRFNLFVDGEFFTGISLETLVVNKLKKGSEVSEKFLNIIKNDETLFEAKHRAINYVSCRLKSKKEVVTYLKQKGYNEEVIEVVLNLLMEYKLIDDEMVAKAYINSHPNQGKKLIALKLMQKGLSKDIIESCCREMDSSAEKLEEIALKYLKGKKKDIKTSAKLYRFLVSRGFDLSEVTKTIKKLFKEQENGSWD